MADEWLRTGIGRSTPDAITVRGRDLANELMGKVTFTELSFFLAANRMPSSGFFRKSWLQLWVGPLPQNKSA